MPTVRKYEPRSTPSQLPGVRAPRAPGPDAFGAEIGEAIGDLGLAVAQGMEKKERLRERELREGRLMGAYAELGQERINIEEWAQQREGVDAAKLDVETEALSALDKRAETIAEALPDDRLRRDFEKTRLSERESLQKKVRAHVAAQAEAVRKQQYEAARLTASSQAATALQPNGEVDPEAFGKAKKIGLDAVQLWTRAWAPEAAEVERRAYLTDMHRKVIEAIQAHPNSGPVRAQAYLEYVAPEMDGAVVADLRKELRPGAVASQAEAAVTRILGETVKDGKTGAARALTSEERLQRLDGLPAEVAPKARQILREREALAEEARADVQRGYVGTLRDGIASGALRSEASLEKHPAFGKLDPGYAAEVRDYLVAKQRQAAADARLRENRSEGREQQRRDTEFVTWFARQPAVLRLSIDVDMEAALRGASVTAANRAGTLQLATQERLPKMFDQRGYQDKVEQAALAQWPDKRASGAKVIDRKPVRDAFVGEFRQWHDAEIAAGRDVDERALMARMAERLRFGEETEGLVNKNMTRFEAERKGLGFQPFPANEQKHPLVRAADSGELAGAAPVAPPRRPRRTDPATGETREWDGSRWVKVAE